MKILAPNVAPQGEKGEKSAPEPEGGVVNINPGNIHELAKGSSSNSPVANAVAEAFEEARLIDEAEANKVAEAKRRAVEAASHVKVGTGMDRDPVLDSAAGSSDLSGEVAISQEHKDAFLSALIGNTRYEERFSLFGGKVSACIRSRTLEETDSIEAYLRNQVASGVIKTANDYANVARKIVLAAQVKELNGVYYDELKGPMRMSENASGVSNPGWVEQMDAWGKKSSAIAVALTRCIVEFESRYWFMVDNAGSTNFWHRGESTAE